MFLLNKEISFLKDKFFGLDISDTSVKVLQLEKRGKNNLIRSCGFSRIVEGSVVDGVILNKENVIWSIKNAIDSAGPKKINTNKVICSLPESKVFSRIIDIPEVDPKGAGEAIKWQIEENIPLTVEQVYYDWQLLENTNNKISEGKKIKHVLTVSVSKEIIDSLMELLKSAGLEVYALEPEAIANLRSLVPARSSLEEITVIADIGLRKTSLIIAEGNIPYFVSDVPFTSEGLTDLISKHFGISEKEAEELKIQQVNSSYDEKNSILTVADSLLENLFSGIEKSIDFYFTTMKKNHAQIKRIVLVGGGANLQGLTDFLSKKLGKMVEIGDPLINLNLHKKSPIIDKSISPSYSVVAGLALKGISYGDKS